MKPNKTIGSNYLERWHLIPKNRYFNVWLHKTSGSDSNRACHDHPWDSVSFLLKGELIEVTPDKEIAFIKDLQPYPENLKMSKVPWLKPVYRPAQYAHRLVVPEGPVWTLFVTGPRKREWGFLYWLPNRCKYGWVPGPNSSR
jgi:hypothetical protein